MKKMKKFFGIFMLAAVMVCSMAACGSKSKEEPAVSQADADSWMDETGDANTQSADTEEDYFDVANVEDQDVDYSKYEEKTTTKTTGNTTQNGTSGGQDTYYTDPVPEGQQNPVEPEDAQVDTSKTLTCYLTISCATILDNMADLTEGKEDLVPANGLIFKKQKVTFYEGESVFDILRRVTQNSKIHMEFVNTPKYNSAYIEGINNLYEFDCGSGSGWMYNVNGWYPNYGCSRYAVQDGDEIEWNYTCDLGRDLGTTWMD